MGFPVPCEDIPALTGKFLSKSGRFREPSPVPNKNKLLDIREKTILVNCRIIGANDLELGVGNWELGIGNRE
jgi:hypothetical protein